MIEFTTINSNNFWKNKSHDLANFFTEMEGLEYWTINYDELYTFFVLFESNLNSFHKVTSIIDDDYHFQKFLEILAYLKISDFFYLIIQINETFSNFLIPSLLKSKIEDTVYERLFIERFQLLERYGFLTTIFEDNKVKTIRLIISN